MLPTNSDINSLLTRYDRFINISADAHNPFPVALPRHAPAGSGAARVATTAQTALTNTEGQNITWKATKVLSQGRFGIVLEVECNGVKRALKLFKLSEEQDVDGELSIWHSLTDEEGIVKLVGKIKSDVDEFHGESALMELYDGSLDGKIKDLQAPLSVFQIKHIADQIILALSRMHAKEVAHVDLACRNILVRGATNMPMAHINDFGHALYLQGDNNGNRHQDDKKEFQADIFACGSIISMLDSLQSMTGIKSAIANRFRKNLTSFKASMWNFEGYEQIFKIFCGENRSYSQEEESLEGKGRVLHE